MQPTASEIKVLFDRIAPVYDQLNERLSLGQHRIWKLMAVKWCEPSPGNVGLDLCCGSGDLARLLARRVGTTGKVIGVDFSPQLLAIARSLALQTTPDLNMSWVEADVLDLPFPDNSFDCATMGYGLRNVTDKTRCLEELHRVLKPGAKAAILDFHLPHQPWMQRFQAWYLETVVVPMAQQHGLTEEYAYIWSSLQQFPTGAEQVKLGAQAGFTQTIHYPIAGGMMGVLVLVKA